MCGISICYSPDPKRAASDIAKMVGTLTHRGPDADGTYVDPVRARGALGLGHNRLSILDLSDHACQPMRSTDGRYVLVYNGEVYNYRELRAQLGSDAPPPDSTGDTAVVLAALIKWGPAALQRFNGMWALALYDREAGTVLLSRDRFGKKPLYYFQDGETFYLASEIKAILAATERRFRVNPRVAVPYLTRGLLNTSEETFFEDIRQFPPSSWELLTPGRGARVGTSTQRYWYHPFELGETATAGSVSPQQITDLFLDAVGLRLRSDVPVGLLLSGGIDSSAMLGAVARIGSLDNVTVLSVVSNDPRVNEEPFIDTMTRHVGCHTHKVNVSANPALLLDLLGDATWYNDAPMAGFSPLAHMNLMRIAAERGLKVLLTGQGADEQLGGYNKFFYFYLFSLLQERRVLSAIRTVAQFATHSDTLREFQLHEAMRYLGRPQLARGAFIAPERLQFDTVEIGYQGSYAHREWLDLARTSVPALLHNEDRMSMSQSLEMRAPFLDFRLVELLAHVHPSEKFEGGWTKSIFRKAIGGIVPDEIRYRRDKRGFSVPETGWMSGELRGRVRELFASELISEELRFIDKRALITRFDQFHADRGTSSRPFFRAYAFEVFLRRFAPSIAA